MIARIKKSDSGYIYIRFNGEIWGQVPPGFDLWSADKIPDEYLFNPNWTRNRFNELWKENKEKLLGQLKNGGGEVEIGN